MSNLSRPVTQAFLAALVILLVFTGWGSLEHYLGLSLSELGRNRLHIVRDVTTAVMVSISLIFWAERRIRQMEKEEEKQERHLAEVLKESTNAIVCVDKEGEIVYWNRGAELLYGYRPAEVLGQMTQLRVLRLRQRQQACRRIPHQTAQ